jgi:GT2 family glycosyltransferase
MSATRKLLAAIMDCQESLPSLENENMSVASASHILSVVIPVRPGGQPAESELTLVCRRPDVTIELLVVSGNNVSEQRNRAVREATGEFLYFLDDDSKVAAGAIDCGLDLLLAGEVDLVGGPALTTPNATPLQTTFGEVVGCRFGSAITQARNEAIGEPRPVREDELVFCNLMMRKSVYEKAGGMDPLLYPGEDIDLLKRVAATGARMFYIPFMAVCRTRRPTMLSFSRQYFSYGDGRGRRFLKLTRLMDVWYVMPSLFCLYLLSLSIFNQPFCFAPLIFYGLFCLLQSLIISFKTRNLLSGLFALTAFPVLHLSYGIGFLKGVIHCLSYCRLHSMNRVHAQNLSSY